MKNNPPRIIESNTFKIIFKSIVSIALLLLVFRFIGIGKIYNELLNTNLCYIAVSVFFVVFQVLFKAIRWNTIIQIFNRGLGIASSSTYTLIAHAFGIITPGRLGEFIKAKYLADKISIGYLKSFLTVVIDKAFDIATTLLFVLAGFSFLNKEIFFTNYSAFALFLYIFVLVLTFFYLGKILKLISRFIPRKYKNNFKTLKISREIYIKSLFFSILIWATLCIQAFFIIRALNIPQVTFYVILSIVPLMALSSMLPISIGGVGVREIVAIYFFMLFGIPAEKSAIFSLLYTFITFGIPAVIGSVLYIKRMHLAK
ncbi:flippase-like domain-containing protein [Candidatus Woesearchaeota archaeon]|nr:flippase-like domain-containing protein [Candidatus Woesearchaeota archaeon]